MWFRIAIHQDGSVASCAAVEARQVDGRHVYYVEAESEVFAISTAVSRFQAYKKRQREQKAEHRAARLAAGGCSECGEPTNGTRRCDACNERENGIRRHGLPKVGQGKVTPRIEELRLQRAGRSQRYHILNEVLSAAIRMKAGIAFISWLRAERDAAESGKAVAAE